MRMKNVQWNVKKENERRSGPRTLGAEIVLYQMEAITMQDNRT